MRRFKTYMKLMAENLGVIGTAGLMFAAEGIVGFLPDHRAEAVILNRTGRTTAQPQPKADRKDTKLEISVSIPMSKISSIANQMSFQIENSGSQFGFKYEATIMLDKPTVSSSGDPVHPIAVAADFRFEGHINGRNAEGSGSATLPLAVDIGQDWCPVVDVGKPSIRWNTINVPFLVRIAIDSGLIDGILQSEVAKLADCGVIKNRLASVWQTVAFPILSMTSLKSKATTFYLNIRPRNIAITDIKVANDQISARIQVTSSSYIDQQPIKKEKVDLPADPTKPIGDANDAGREIKTNVFGDVAVGPP